MTSVTPRFVGNAEVVVILGLSLSLAEPQRTDLLVYNYITGTMKSKPSLWRTFFNVKEPLSCPFLVW